MSESNDDTLGRHAFYSEKAANQCGYSIYSLESGVHVKVTGVYTSVEDGMENYGWDDKVFVGIVDRYISRGSDGDYDPQHEELYYRKLKTIIVSCEDDVGFFYKQIL